jgi:hypothetical protein
MDKSALIVGVEKEPPVKAFSFKLPDGIDLEEAKEGDVIERVVSIKIGSNGMGELQSIEGIPLGNKTEEVVEQEPEELEDDTDVIGSLKRSIGVA